MKYAYIKPSMEIMDMDAEELMTILPASGETSGAVGTASYDGCWDDEDEGDNEEY